jgi:hypothetical protein
MVNPTPRHKRSAEDLAFMNAPATYQNRPPKPDANEANGVNIDPSPVTGQSAITLPFLQNDIVFNNAVTVESNENNSTLFSPSTNRRDNRDTVTDSTTTGLSAIFENVTDRDRGVTDRDRVELPDFLAAYANDDYIPYGFTLKYDGIYKIAYGEGKKTSKPKRGGAENQDSEATEDDAPTLVKVCSPLVVADCTEGAERGYRLDAVIRGGRRVSMTLLADEVHQDARELTRWLERQGVKVEYSQLGSVAKFICSSRALADNRTPLVSVDKMGWIDGERLAFMLPEGCVGVDDHIFQAREANRSAATVHPAGTLADWVERVAAVSVQDDACLLAMLHALSSPLLELAQSDTPLLHFYGTTSRGKTTLGQIAASCWGNGSDPSRSPKNALTKGFNGTPNALRAGVTELSGTVAVLDDVRANTKGFGQFIYDLCSGEERARLNRDASKKAQREYLLPIVSTGEVSLREVVESAGEAYKGGMAIRALDIRFPEGGIAVGGKAQVDALKEDCGRFYGTAGRALVNHLVVRFENKAHLAEFIKNRVTFYETLLKSGELPNEIARAAKRFALMAVTGELAIDAKVLPCEQTRMEAAVLAMWQRWRVGLPVVNDGERAIEAICDYIKSNPAKFPNGDTDPDRMPSGGVAGYFKIDGNQGLYLFTNSGFEEATRGLGKANAIAALRAQGLLVQNNGARAKSRHTVPVLGGGRPEFYAVKESIMNEDERENNAESKIREDSSTACHDSSRAVTVVSRPVTFSKIAESPVVVEPVTVSRLSRRFVEGENKVSAESGNQPPDLSNSDDYIGFE